jgi:septum site-determining protein MinD
MEKTTFINVVSGKGGTGKTLLCTILAELLGNQNVSVLVVDMDIFVRGLTALLYFHKGESMRLSQKNEVTVSDVFYNINYNNASKLAIHKYRSFDIAPAVSRIDQVFDLEKEIIFDFKHNKYSFNRILDFIPKDKYDYVFFDCRSGYDSLVSTIHNISDFTICVQEEDDISDVTANNLISQLERDCSIKTIFRLVNKARNSKTLDELNQKQKKGVSSLGYIPFDMDVLNSFGERSFWDDISRSLYKAAVAESWNKLAAKAELKHILYFKRYSPLFSGKIEKTFGILGQSDRLFAFIGFMLGFSGLFYSLFGTELYHIFKFRTDIMVSVFISAFGFFIFLYSFINKKRNK